jgi:hypothetical protein
MKPRAESIEARESLGKLRDVFTPQSNVGTKDVLNWKFAKP